MTKKQSRYNCTWQPVTKENPDGYIVNQHVYTKEMKKYIDLIYNRVLELKRERIRLPIKNK